MPLKNATPVERAGFTEVLEIGIEIRWIKVRDRPMDRPAKPFGARASVEPRITNRNIAVRTISVMITEMRPKCSGEWSPKPFAAMLPVADQPFWPVPIQ